MNGDDPEEGVRLLHRAYSLGAPDTHIDFYRDFAELYDRTYAASLGYIYPLGIASVLSGQNVRREPSSTSGAARAWLRRPFARSIRTR